MKVKVLHLRVGTSMARYLEVEQFPAYLSPEGAHRHVDYHGSAVLIRQNWLSDYLDKRGTLIEDLYCVLPEDVYAKLVEPEANEYGEVSP